MGFPRGSVGKNSACNVGDLSLIQWLSIPVLWPGEFRGLYSPWGRKESDTTESVYWKLRITGSRL